MWPQVSHLHIKRAVKPCCLINHTNLASSSSQTERRRASTLGVAIQINWLRARSTEVYKSQAWTAASLRLLDKYFASDNPHPARALARRTFCPWLRHLSDDGVFWLMCRRCCCVMEETPAQPAHRKPATVVAGGVFEPCHKDLKPSPEGEMGTSPPEFPLFLRPEPNSQTFGKNQWVFVITTEMDGAGTKIQCIKA